MKVCPKCQNHESDSMNFCSQCGSRLELQAVTREEMPNPKKRMSTSKWILIVGIVILVIGMALNLRYEDAAERGYEVEAEVVEVVHKERYDPDTGTEDRYIVYADYTVDGKEYTHKKVGTYAQPKHEGDIIEVVVNPENPKVMLPEGGVFGVVGFLMILYGAFAVRKEKKTAQNQAQ